MKEENNVIIKTEGVKVNFGDFWALKGIDIEVITGEIIVILGPSGSGKSTFIRTLNRLQPHSDGKIIIDDITIDEDTSVSDLKSIRSEIGFVFQQFNLFPHLTIMENITLAPMKVNGVKKKEAEKKAIELLERVGIPEQAYKYPSELSGGQQQRVAIARSIAKRPNLLLGDELTGNLDTETSQKVMTALVKACKEENITAVFVTHDEGLVHYATRVIRIDSGKIISDQLVNTEDE